MYGIYKLYMRSKYEIKMFLTDWNALSLFIGQIEHNNSSGVHRKEIDILHFTFRYSI